MSEGFSPDWLALREPADAAARSAELLEPLRDHLAGLSRLVICDLGCGTGSMGRWLGSRLPKPQHWILFDHDPELLRHAQAQLGGETRQRDLSQLTAADLAGASLVTASALLDLFTLSEVNRLVAACVGAECPALLTLSVAGQVQLSPADPLDGEIVAAFNAHQRREQLLGPDAVDAAADEFTRLGAKVEVRPSPWRLGPEHAALTAEWLRGWVGAACEQESRLAGPAAAYLQRRLDAATAGELRVIVQHTDLFAHSK